MLTKNNKPLTFLQVALFSAIIFCGCLSCSDEMSEPEIASVDGLDVFSNKFKFTKILNLYNESGKNKISLEVGVIDASLLQDIKASDFKVDFIYSPEIENTITSEINESQPETEDLGGEIEIGMRVLETNLEPGVLSYGYSHQPTEEFRWTRRTYYEYLNPDTNANQKAYRVKRLKSIQGQIRVYEDLTRDRLGTSVKERSADYTIKCKNCSFYSKCFDEFHTYGWVISHVTVTIKAKWASYFWFYTQSTCHANPS